MLSTTRRIASEGLQLRAWAARRLLGGDSSPPPEVGAAAWDLFLYWERCGVLLRHSLTESGTELAPQAARVLDERVIAELRRILSSRAQMKRVARIAGELGMEVVVLKGTADVARGMDLFVMDVDVLVRPEDVDRLGAALDEDGFEVSGGGGHYHLAPRRDPHSLQVEVHRAVSGFDDPADIPWDRLQPLEGYEPLVGFDPADHAWTSIGQAVRIHPDRRQRLRDLYLLRQALQRATEEQRDRLRRFARSDPYGDASLRLLDLVERDGIPPAGSAAERALRRMYLLQARRLNPPPKSFAQNLWVRGIDSVAAGSFGNFRRYYRTRTFARPASSEPIHWAGRALIFAAAAAGAHLRTFDAWRVPLPDPAGAEHAAGQ